MNVSELLREMHSRQNTDFIAKIILEHPPLFKELWKIFLANEEPISRRAAWVVDVITEKRPEWMTDLIEELVDTFPSFVHDGMKRHSLHILSRSTLPEDKLGEIAGFCFDWLMKPGEAVATKMYSMEILYRISEIEPDLKHELADTIRLQMIEGTPGIRSCGKRVLGKLMKDASSIRL
ncbi:MAG: hypothetical protein WCM93_04940 [Bacteroidota bacterium]